MPTVTNTSDRPITIDGNLIAPKAQAEVSDEVMEWRSVKALVEDKELEVAKKKAAEPAAAPAAGAAPKA